MRLTTCLDFNLVALAEDDELTLMLELTPTPAATHPARAPAAIEVVLDRSGSMRGTRLRTAVTALDRLVRWLDAEDRFGLVSFDAEAEVVIPAGPLTDKRAVHEAIARIATGAGSNMSTGYAAGIAEAGSMLGDAGVTVLVISDGHANLGARRAWEFERQAASARGRGITTTTLALGSDADGRLLSAIAYGGVGTALSATRPDLAAALLGGEIDGLLQPAVQSVQLEFHTVPSVSSLTVLSDVPVSSAGAGPIVEVGDLYHDEQRRLVVSVAVDAINQPGEVKLGEVALRYVTLPSLVPHTFTLPLTVTVVPAPEATRRVADTAVTSEAAFQRVQKVTARLVDGRTTGAGGASATARALATSTAELERLLAAAPADMRDELAQAILWLDGSGVGGLMPRLLPSLRRRAAPPRP